MTAYNVVSPAAMVAGQPEDISVILANLNAIATVLNGNIDNANIAAAAAIGISKLAGYPADITKALRGDGSWGGLSAVSAALNIGAANTDLAAPAGTDNYWVATTAGGTLRSIAAGSAGTRITLKNGTAAGYIRLLHATAGGGAQLSIIGAGHKFLAPGQSIELRYDGAVWVEVNRPAKELICDSILGGSVANFDTDTILGIAASIPQVYSHLRLELILRSDQAALLNDVSTLRVNGDATASYNWTWVQGNGSAVTSASGGQGDTGIKTILYLGAGSVAGRAGVSIAEFIDYRGGWHKGIDTLSTYDADNTAGNQGSRTAGGYWRAGAAINRIQLLPSAGNWVASSRFSLYGIT